MQYGAYSKIGKARENTIKLNLVGARSLEGLGAMGRLGLEVFCYSYIPTLFFSGSFDCLEGDGEVFHQVF